MDEIAMVEHHISPAMGGSGPYNHAICLCSQSMALAFGLSFNVYSQEVSYDRTYTILLFPFLLFYTYCTDFNSKNLWQSTM